MGVEWLKRCYHFLIPLSVRREMWEFRVQGVWAALLDLRWRLRIALGFPLARVRLPQGRLCVDVRDIGVGRPLYQTRRYETAESEFLCDILRPGMTFVDIGAHVGYFTTLASRCVGPSGRVIAVEPDPYNYLLLLHNVRLNRLHNVAASPCALAERAGVGRLFQSEENFGDHRLSELLGSGRPSVDVAVDTLDALLERYGAGGVDVVKMDVQGSEPAVLGGMSRLLGSARPLTILMEFWPYGIEKSGRSPRGLFDLLHSRGFTARALSSQKTITFEQAVALAGPASAAHPDHANVNLVFERTPLPQSLAA